MADQAVASPPVPDNDMLARAAEHDQRAVFFAQYAEAGSIQKAANHFVIAEGLRRLAQAKR